MMKIISLGWGSQSFALAAMSALGTLPEVDLAIHADTRFERKATYDFAEMWTPWLEERGVRVVTVKPEGFESPVVDEWGGVYIPAYTYDIEDNINGILRRQCTHRWKIRPIKRWIREHVEVDRVELWLGITLDEMKRMKPSGVQYIKHRWPFMEREHWNGKLLRRHDAIEWLKKKIGENAVPPRSACYFCPFHSKAEWRRIKDAGDGDWEKALEFDNHIRKARPPYDLFLTSERIPLKDLDLNNEIDNGQIELW